MIAAALRTEIQTGPLAAECAPFVHTPDMPVIGGSAVKVKDQAIADILNRVEFTRIAETRVTDLSLMDALGVEVANTVLDKLTAIGGSNSAVRRAIKAIESERGLDIGNPEVAGVLDQLTQIPAPNGLTIEEASAIKALAGKPCGRAELLFGQAVSAADVSIALRG